MSPCRLVLLSALGGALLIPAFAQTTLPPIHNPGSRAGTSTTTPPNRQHREPCWEQAGVTKQAMEQRRSLEEQSRQQVESVCANASLTLIQKREEIRSIRERTRQEVEGLITPQQREAMKACQESRGHGEHIGGGGGGRGMGPCGEMTAAPPVRAPGQRTSPPTAKPTPEEEN